MNKWVASKGRIAIGQGTPAVMADTTGLGGEPITVNVEITGLPKTCKNVFSGNGLIAPRQMLNYAGMPAEEYGKASWDEERSKLDNLVLYFNYHNEIKIFFLFSSTNDEKIGTLRKRIIKVVKYLRHYGIKRERLIIEAVKENERITRAWFIEKDGKSPNWIERINSEKTERINIGKI